jgi:hypothetical protein
VQNFTITEDIAEFSVEPGFAETKENFSIQLRNLLDKEITIKIDLNKVPSQIVSAPQNSSGNSSSDFWDDLFGAPSNASYSSNSQTTSSVQEIVLGPSEIKTVDLSFPLSSESVLKIAEFSSETTLYSLPVHILKSEIKPKVPVGKGELSFDPKVLNLSISSYPKQENYSVYLLNTGNSTIENITLHFDKDFSHYFDVSPVFITEITAKTSVALNVSLVSQDYYFLFDNNSFSKSVQGYLKAESNSSESYMEIKLELFKDYSNNTIEEKGCFELNGVICSQNLSCDVQTKYTPEGNCCFGKCTEKTPSPNLQVIGIVLILIVVGLLFWFFKYKYKGVRNNPDLMKVAEGKRK